MQKPTPDSEEQPLPTWYEEWLRQQTNDPTFNPDNSDDVKDRFRQFKSQLDRILGRFSTTGRKTPQDKKESLGAVPIKQFSGLTQDMVALEMVIPQLIATLDRSEAEDYAADHAENQ